MAPPSLLRYAIRALLPLLLLCTPCLATEAIQESSPVATADATIELRALQTNGAESDNFMAKERKRKQEMKRARREKLDAKRKEAKLNAEGWEIVEEYFEAYIDTLCGNGQDGSLDAGQTAKLEKSFKDFFNLDAECDERSDDHFLDVEILEFMGSDNCMGTMRTSGGVRRMQTSSLENLRKRSQVKARRRLRCKRCNKKKSADEGDAEIMGADSNNRLLSVLPRWLLPHRLLAVDTDLRSDESDEIKRYLQASAEATSTCPARIVNILRANGFSDVTFVFWYRSAKFVKH